jgi:uncharacterized protein (TIGR02466 family)
MSDAFQAPGWQPNIFRLWPTILVKRTFSDCETHNPALISLVEDMEQQTDQLTASHWRDGKLFEVDHGAIQWLKAGIDETIRGYFDRVGMDYGIGWTIAAWPNINRLGDYHAPHNHAWSYLSGTYYVKVPEPAEGADPTGRASSAGISFYDPRTSVNMLAADGEALGRSEFPVRPSAGTMLMWDSSITHSVHPNLAEDTRISISFNIALAWSDSYLHEE